MPAHYVYREPNKTTLNQGDVLQKTAALITHLDQYHRYYAHHSDYKYFIVLTQTCDLVLRDGVCKSPYITVAAVRPVEEVLRREAASYQVPWQREAGVVGAKSAEKLVMFLTSLLDNNQDGYFYLHQDVGLGIQQSCCAFLPLAVTLKIDHYKLCLDAKIAELSDTFQAKLGSILGNMYSRVASPEWNEYYPDNKVGKEASKLLKRTLLTIDEEKIAEGVAELKQGGRFDHMASADIKEYITRFKITPRRERLKQRAVDVFCAEDDNLIDLLRARVQRPLRTDPELIAGIDSLLTDVGVPEAEQQSLREQILQQFMDRLRHHFCDANMPEKRVVIEKALTRLMQDGTIRTILRDR